MCVCICVRVDSSSNGVTTRDSLIGNTSRINHEQISVSDKSTMSLPSRSGFYISVTTLLWYTSDCCTEGD